VKFFEHTHRACEAEHSEFTAQVMLSFKLQVVFNAFPYTKYYNNIHNTSFEFEDLNLIFTACLTIVSMINGLERINLTSTYLGCHAIVSIAYISTFS